MATTENFLGSNLSGDNGKKNRVLTLNNTKKTVQGGFRVVHSGQYLYLTTDYTVSHNDANTTITFLINVFNDTPIDVIYNFESEAIPGTSAGNFSAAFAQMVAINGKPIRVRYFNQTTGSVWDDDVSLTEDTLNETWTSGIVLPLSTRPASEDAVLVEQGKLSNQAQRLYVNGSLDFTGTGSNLKVKIGMGGSPTSADYYTVIPLGGIPHEVNDVKIYKRVYITKLTNGSLIGEQ